MRERVRRQSSYVCGALFNVKCVLERILDFLRSVNVHVGYGSCGSMSCIASLSILGFALVASHVFRML